MIVGSSHEIARRMTKLIMVSSFEQVKKWLALVGVVG